ncbi:MAG: glycosyltransferase family 1 protein [Rhodospirillales bacterium]|nr:glycosyltransferase family 1 protein [Rhodospirillales bacterium]
MKILIISDAWHPQINGVVRTYEHLGAELKKRDHEIKVLGPSDLGFCLPMPGYSEIKLALFPYRRLKRAIERYNPDHIHLPTEGPMGWAGRKYCLRHARSFSSAFHTRFPEYAAKRIAEILPFAYDYAHAHAVKFVRRFHAPSSGMTVATQSLEDTLRGWGFKNPMVRLTRGVCLDTFTLGKKTLFQDLKGPVALYVGRIAIEKSVEDFLKMNWPGSKVIVGEGPSKAELEQKYPEAVFVGKKTGQNLADHYRSADLFVFPSRTDTFGMVLIEALACGLPVAAYNVTGPKDIITADFLGALHDTDLAAAAQKALENKDAQRRADYVHREYTWEHAGAQYEDMILNIANTTAKG